MAFMTPCWMAAKSLTADLKTVKRPALEAFRNGDFRRFDRDASFKS
jgi:hypothetical protein